MALLLPRMSSFSPGSDLICAGPCCSCLTTRFGQGGHAPQVMNPAREAKCRAMPSPLLLIYSKSVHRTNRRPTMRSHLAGLAVHVGYRSVPFFFSVFAAPPVWKQLLLYGGPFLASCGDALDGADGAAASQRYNKGSMAPATGRTGQVFLVVCISHTDRHHTLLQPITAPDLTSS